MAQLARLVMHIARARSLVRPPRLLPAIMPGPKGGWWMVDSGWWMVRGGCERRCIIIIIIIIIVRGVLFVAVCRDGLH